MKLGCWGRVWYWIKHFNGQTFEDSFMPIVCRVAGHAPYVPDWDDFVWQGEVACKRCHHYIKKYPVKYKRLSPRDNMLVAYIEQKTGEKVTVEFEEKHVRLSWNQNGSDGNTEVEAQRIKRLMDDIRVYSKDRLMEFFYINGRQSVYFRYEIY
jgi:hypothetical protein